MDTECIIWPRIRSDGYGQAWSRAEKRRLQAHRHVWQECFGWIPEGVWVLHKCDTPACVNPDHLFLGTHQDNMRDMVRKGRGRGPGLVGEDIGTSVLTWSKVRRIRALREKECLSFSTLAAMFGCSRKQAWNIVTGKQWKETP